MKKKNSISKQLTRSYLRLFPLFLLSFCIIVIVGALFSHSWLSASLPAHQDNTEELLSENIDEIDISEISAAGGSGAIVHEDGSVKELTDKKIFKSNSLSKQEWTQFLTEVSNPINKNTYSVIYDQNNQAWLVISEPTSVRFHLSLSGNTTAPDFIVSLIAYISLAVILIFLLLLITWLYAKKSSKTFISPLKKLCSSVTSITQGTYELKQEENLNGEFLSIKEDIEFLAFELKQEKILRENLGNAEQQMLLGISHDLRDPLATIMGYAETLNAAKTLDDVSRVYYANVIYKNSIHANNLMNDLSTYAKLNHVGFEPLLKPTDICEFMREQASQFLPQFEILGIEAEFEIPDEELLVPLDKNLFARACSNLIQNILEQNDSNIKFMLRVADEHTHVLIQISDDGVGMDSSLAKNIFHPFVRADDTRDSQTRCSGLGLAIAHKIIKAHGGDITLDTDIDKGYIFNIELKI